MKTTEVVNQPNPLNTAICSLLEHGDKEIGLDKIRPLIRSMIFLRVLHTSKAAQILKVEPFLNNVLKLSEKDDSVYIAAPAPGGKCFVVDFGYGDIMRSSVEGYVEVPIGCKRLHPIFVWGAGSDMKAADFVGKFNAMAESLVSLIDSSLEHLLRGASDYRKSLLVHKGRTSVTIPDFTETKVDRIVEINGLHYSILEGSDPIGYFYPGMEAFHYGDIWLNPEGIQMVLKAYFGMAITDPLRIHSLS